MASRKNEVRVGIAVLLALLILVVGIMWLKGFQLAQKTSTIYATFSEVGGLQKGDAVQVNGYAAGHVGLVHMVGDSVEAALEIPEDVRIGRDALVTIRDRGMMGEKYVLIRTRHPRPSLPDGAHVTGQFETGMAEVLAMSGAMLQDLQGLTSQISQVLHGGQGRDLESVMGDLSALTEELRATAVENRADLRVGMTEFRRSASQMDTLLRRHGHEVVRTMRTADRTAARADSLTRRLIVLADSLQAVTAQVQAGRGTLGHLAYNDSLYNALTATVQQVSSLVDDVKKHPRKYFKFSVF